MTAEVQAYIEAEKQADRNVSKACELLEVSRSAWGGGTRGAEPSA